MKQLLIITVLLSSIGASQMRTVTGGITYPTINPAFPVPANIAVCAMNTSTNVQCAALMQIPRSGTITDIGWFSGSVTSAFAAGDTLRVTLETVASGVPSGTAYKGSGVTDYAGVGAIAAATEYSSTLASPATNAVLGDLVAVRFQFTAWQQANFQVSLANTTLLSGYPIALRTTDGGTNWTRSSGAVAIMFKYGADGWFPADSYPPCVRNTYAMNTDASTYDQYGIHFVSPFSGVSDGVWVSVDIAGTSTNYKINLMDSAYNVLKTTSISGINEYDLANGSPRYYKWATTQTITAGTVYALTVEANSASANNVTVSDWGCSDATKLSNISGGTSIHSIRRTRATAAWEDALTSRAWMGLTFSSLSLGGGHHGFAQ